MHGAVGEPLVAVLAPVHLRERREVDREPREPREVREGSRGGAIVEILEDVVTDD